MKYSFLLLGISFVAISQEHKLTIDQDHYPDVISIKPIPKTYSGVYHVSKDLNPVAQMSASVKEEYKKFLMVLAAEEAETNQISKKNETKKAPAKL